ncbi:DUF3800 domain-containing protein [Psychromicrobium sp. YIM B11713]|uniref:DUF3800 domain-containing protein n=1 Tax=Psychromicrobium sp. YIM B11713 TaxID=3145233 RepID=UPI00374E4061
MLLICYIDESGDEQQLRTATDPPLFVMAGLIVDHENAKNLIMEFLQLKKQYNPMLAKDDIRLSEILKFEVKGSELRKEIRSGNRRAWRRSYGFLDRVIEMLERHNVSILGEIYVKNAGPLNPWVYAEAVAALALQFEAQLRAAQVPGAMVLDASTKTKNVPSVNRITTERFKRGGDPFRHLIESPVFGHSDAHVVLQLADIISSAFLFPMGCAAFCNSLIDNVHIADQYADIRTRYGPRLRLLENRYQDMTGKKVGGVRVHDHMNMQPSIALYQKTDFIFRER